MNWSVDSVAGGNAAWAPLQPTGLYTAPSTSGQHTIAAASQADAKASANTTITVNPSPGFAISPDSATVLVSSQQTFQAHTCGAAADGVSWTVDGVPGGSDSVGIISVERCLHGPGIGRNAYRPGHRFRQPHRQSQRRQSPPASWSISDLAPIRVIRFRPGSWASITRTGFTPRRRKPRWRRRGSRCRAPTPRSPISMPPEQPNWSAIDPADDQAAGRRGSMC